MRILSSPRRRRRLLIATAFVAPIAPLIYLGVHFSDPGDPGAATGPAVVPEYTQPKKSPFTASEQQAVRQVLREFIKSAVAREDVGRSWSLAAGDLRQGVTRKEWNHGDLPVVPYPAAHRGLGSWSYVEYSYKRAVGLEVFLFPKPRSGWSAMTADVELVKGRDGRWRVDYWMPKKFHGPPAVAAKTKAKANAAQKPKKASAATRNRRAAARQAAPEEPEALPKPSRAWWIVPIAILSLIVVAPLSIGIGVWRRNRRAEREYLRGRSP